MCDVTNGVKMHFSEISGFTIVIVTIKNLPISSLMPNDLLFSDLSGIGILPIMARYGSIPPFQKNPGDFLLPHFQVKKMAFP